MNEATNTLELIEACFRSLIIGGIQGLTEFLPISSTAHLKVVPLMLGWKDPGISMTAILQLGSILAVISYFKTDLQQILRSTSSAFRHRKWGTFDFRLGLAICVGTSPIILTGMLIKLFWDEYENSFLRSIPSIALISILMAILLAIAEKNGTQTKDMKKISIKDGLLIGVGQILALIPGVSRSGITLSTALLLGLKRQDAAKFSFLLGIPAISLAGLAELSEVLRQPFTLSQDFLPLFFGLSSATIVSWLVIDWLLKYFQKNSTWIFIIYRLLFGLYLLNWYWGITSR